MRTRHLPLAFAAFLLAGCASTSGDGDSRAGGTSDAGGDLAAGGGGISRTQNDLMLERDLGDGSPAQSWTLVCAGFAEGSHPDPEGACAHLAGTPEPFAPIPGDVACTEQYGGPETARITGQWAGEPVDLELSRVNGCHIAQWDSLEPAFPPREVAPAN